MTKILQCVRVPCYSLIWVVTRISYKLWSDYSSAEVKISTQTYGGFIYIPVFAVDHIRQQNPNPERSLPQAFCFRTQV